MVHLHALLVGARYNTHESNPVAVFRIHVGLNFKHEASEFLFARLNYTLSRLTRHR
ncbi:Uncharacterised protein [Vibrio cholerae]|uniref:Uncharacterized protein n=1 Tax=Vibrio cholerae TaxID=666 RepID=A0A655SUY7_VIBCL|nr:Uncharacterised protein [Vibrio cholerae]CSB38528.1 Uncharacterised protein [Vibrio cholerae]CSB47219.1 Uncharacterised protein [Vibrio cholerae]CSB92077.1 Uncharacterised protein [Vibrio cholerae]CSC01888.1 Uncharacterised protein [Vibrio cholerae]